MENLKLQLIFNKPTNSNLIDKFEEIQEKLDEFLSTVMMTKQNRFVKPIRKKVLEVEKKLLGVQDLLEEWIKCQRAWLYLKPIFVSEDLKKKMPVEKQKFDTVDKSWETIMTGISNNPKIFDIDHEKTREDFVENNVTLEEIQKSLSEYLESKRSDFPRFYFLSDDELIEIISKTQDPTLVIKYLNKCFEGICSLEFKGLQEVIAAISEEGEKIHLFKPINVGEGEKKGAVEKWLSELEEVMRNTIALKVKDCLNDTKTERVVWISKWPGQVVLAINQCKWTNNVEQAILDNSLEKYKKTMSIELSEIVDRVRRPLDSLERKTLEALIVLDVHSNYVVDELIRERVSSIEQFPWISQLRYQMNKKDQLLVLIMTSSYDYQYEYLGNSSRLVITPLTDRCYRTLMNAFQYNYGGAPEGPAGTGKTETVKDLAKAVAVQCNVFNCTDQINYIAMNKFFKGLAQTGSWCCFDEFNRIKPEVLSVIAVQVRMIQNAIKEGKRNFFFEGKNIKLIPSCAINITMNPGYAGRADLPDNLKALFRPCAMMVPDYSLIAEICLYSYGFQNANYLSKKIVMALKLSSEQLSSQKHYDFGMRALKSILVAAGNLKKNESGVTEDQQCLQALKNVNLPKFTKNDIPLFNSIISDLFPQIKHVQKNWDPLINEMKEACSRHKLIPKQSFLDKAIEIYEMILVRHGLMVVGPTMGGKTHCLKVLQEAISSIDKPVQSRKINPKSVTGFQLYGCLNPDTKAWTEGVIPQVMKDCENDAQKPEYKWVIFDGPVDAEWIENMNTVLDDNKVLCLTNGQKIKLTQWMTMMFEVEDLISASPATVSRCGMILMEPQQLGWKTLVEKFLNFHLHQAFSQFLKIFQFNLEWFYSSALAFIKKMCKMPLEVNEVKLIDNSLSVLKFLLKEYE